MSYMTSIYTRTPRCWKCNRASGIDWWWYIPHVIPRWLVFKVLKGAIDADGNVVSHRSPNINHKKSLRKTKTNHLNNPIKQRTRNCPTTRRYYYCLLYRATREKNKIRNLATKMRSCTWFPLMVQGAKNKSSILCFKYGKMCSVRSTTVVTFDQSV